MNPSLRIILAPNAFKESLSARQAARELERGVRRVLPAARCERVPVADGGDGTLEALCAGGRIRRRRVSGPLGEPVVARYGWLPESGTAVVELAEAAGLRLLSGRRRNPLRSSTYGAGELILAAVRAGARRVIVGLGGSATVDCGMGLAQALGARLLDARGRELKRGGAELARLHAIELGRLRENLRGVRIEAACDVEHRLLGVAGGIRVFSPQKGAMRAQVSVLERGAAHFAAVARHELGIDVAGARGGGAAGGAGAGMLALLGAALRPGSELILEALDFERRARGADLILTGEGRIDGQTCRGKAPAAVAAVAQRLGVPCIALCGAIAPGAEQLHALGVASILAIGTGPLSLAEALRRAPQLLRHTAEQAVRAWLAGRQSPRGRSY